MYYLESEYRFDIPSGYEEGRLDNCSFEDIACWSDGNVCEATIWFWFLEDNVCVVRSHMRTSMRICFMSTQGKDEEFKASIEGVLADKKTTKRGGYTANI